jgi:hypothetical protein
MPRELDPVRGEIRVAGFRRVSHGLYLPLSDRSTSQEWLRDLEAWRLVLPPDAVFTHLTAAALYGWWLPSLPDVVPVFAAVDLDSRRPRRPGLVCSRLIRPEDGQDRGAQEVSRRHGQPVDSPEEVLLRAARDLALIDLVPLVDSALRHGDVDRTDLERFCRSTRPGVRRLRLATGLADRRSESRWETLLRLFHVSIGVDVEPQVWLYDDQGTFLARADLLVVGTNNVHEYDGGVHREPPIQRRDLRRERRLAGTPFVRRGYTADDLVNHPLVMMAEIDRALGRRHRPERMRLWRRWVEESTLSESGRRRLLMRWNRLSGVTDWSQTA